MSLRDQAKAAKAATTPAPSSNGHAAVAPPVLPDSAPPEVYSPPVGAGQPPTPVTAAPVPESVGSLKLTRAQYEVLLQAIHGNRVQQLRGNSHLEQWDVRRTLTRIFGFGGYHVETIELTMVKELEIPGNPFPDGRPGRSRWTIVYRAQVRLTIMNPDGSVGAVYEDGAAGDSQNQPSLGDAHDQAMKTALSQALKRCAVNLGDQFGMSLYNKGATGAVVLRTLVGPGVADAARPGPAPAVAEIVDSEPVFGEGDAYTSVPDDHYDAADARMIAEQEREREQAVPHLPTAQELANKALDPRTSKAWLRGTYASINPKNPDATRPELASIEVTNGTGDDEKLGMVIYNAIQARRNEPDEEQS